MPDLSSAFSADSFFTIGHSNRPIEAFLDLLQDFGVTQIVDVRKMPRSRSNPQYDAEALAHTLAKCQIAYKHVASLGGLRGKHLFQEDSPNVGWRNQSFRNYADYAMSPAIHEGLVLLRQIGRQRRTAYMCAEAVWWRCHRRIITDYLLAEGGDVFHILGRNQVAQAHMTPGAQGDGERHLIYPEASDDG